jgi:hypothetical protein
MNFVQDAVGVASTLAFAVETYGPFISGAVQGVGGLLKIFFPGSDTEFAALASQVESEWEQQDVDQAVNQLVADADWLTDLYNHLNDPAFSSTPVTSHGEWLINNVRDPLYAKLSGNTPTTANLINLRDWIDVPGVIESMVFGVSTYISLCRQQVATDLVLASIAQQNDSSASTPVSAKSPTWLVIL